MRYLWCALLALATAAPAAAQGAAQPTLSLVDALALARKNNPPYLEYVNARLRSEAGLRYAYGAFFPTATSNFGASYRQGRQEFFAGVAFGSNSDVLSSNWSLTFSELISLRAIAALRGAQAHLDAADADVSSQEQTLRASVTQQYLLVLQSQAQAVLQDTLVGLNQLQLDLAKAKAGVGSATSLDVKRAEVALGRQQVAALRAHNTANVEMLRLFQNIGIPAQPDARLTSTFLVTEPTLDQNQLFELARRANPALRALRAREEVATQGYRSAQNAYAPQLSVNASLGGVAQSYKDPNYLVTQAQQQTASSRASCFTTDSIRRGAGITGLACSSIVFTDAQATALRASNENFPFRLQPNPFSLSVGLSLPLFDGLGRETRLETTAADRSDARLNVRAQELRLATDVAAAHSTLGADYRALRLQEQNTLAAREALQLAQERYRVGLNSLVDLQQARSDFEGAETDRINAIFEYHRAYAALESAVGRALR